MIATMRTDRESVGWVGPRTEHVAVQAAILEHIALQGSIYVPAYQTLASFSH